MDREERIKEEDVRQGLMVDFNVYDFINKIYDDFESRTCENCKHAKKVIGCPCCHHGFECSDITRYSNSPVRVDSDFGCNKFKRKQ